MIHGKNGNGKKASEKMATEKNGNGRNGNRKIGQRENSATKIEMIEKKGNSELLSEITKTEYATENGLFQLPFLPLPFFLLPYLSLIAAIEQKLYYKKWNEARNYVAAVFKNAYRVFYFFSEVKKRDFTFFN